MKNLTARMVVVVVLSFLMLGGTVRAQYVERTVKADIPFDFVLGNQAFPAGRYSVVLLGPATLELRNSEGRALVDVLTHPVEASNLPARSKLRFESEGGHHALTQIWQAGDATGRQIVQSRPASVAAHKRTGRVQTAEAGDPR